MLKTGAISQAAPYIMDHYDRCSQILICINVQANGRSGPLQMAQSETMSDAPRTIQPVAYIGRVGQWRNQNKHSHRGKLS